MLTSHELLLKFKEERQPWNPEKLFFTGVGEKDVYNITAPFEDDGELVIAGRVESRDSENSEVYFFVERDGKWIPRENTKKYKLQDPFVTKINDELVFGGVEIFTHPENPENLWWRTIFYRGKNINSLKQFAVGPNGMKDIRLVGLANGAIGVFTRPQGEKGGRGKIGFFKIDKLEDLTIEKIESAPLLAGQFIDEEWGGVNEAHLLSNGLIGVLGHIANFDQQQNRHYYSMEFCLDPETLEHTKLNIIAERNNMREGEAKRPDLVDVLFSGGLVRNKDGTATLYTGVSDVEAQRITICDPFLKYEK
nr:DUF1861 family protein [Vulcanibacillus modesticaldus]